jgi:hypothetical protein
MASYVQSRGDQLSLLWLMNTSVVANIKTYKSDTSRPVTLQSEDSLAPRRRDVIATASHAQRFVKAQNLLFLSCSPSFGYF